MDEKAGYPQHFDPQHFDSQHFDPQHFDPQHYDQGPFVVPNGNALRDMEKGGDPQRLEAGLLLVPDGHDAPMVVSELPQPVNAGRLPARTGSARRENDACPINVEPLEHEGDDGDKRDSTTVAPSATAASSARESKTAGMTRRKLWIAVICAAILIAVIIGAAVGGTQAAKNSKKEPAAASSPSAAPNNNTNTSSAPTKSTSASPTPTIRTMFTLQVWSEPSYKGATQFFYNTGGYKLSFTGKSYSWNPGKFYKTYQCSVALCLNNGNTGWRGLNPKDWPGPAPNESDYGLVYVNLACDENFRDPGCPGPADASTYLSIPAIKSTSRDPTKTVVYSDGMSTADATTVTAAAATTSAEEVSTAVTRSGESLTRSVVASATPT